MRLIKSSHPTWVAADPTDGKIPKSGKAPPPRRHTKTLLVAGGSNLVSAGATRVSIHLLDTYFNFVSFLVEKLACRA